MEEAPVPVSPEAAAGAAAYSKLVLAVYDLEVLHFELPFVFKCPLRRVRELYDAHVSARHLDVGVGTGYFLDKCKFPVADPAVHLMDLNASSLERTSRRIARYRPVAHRWNALEPFPRDLPRFRSIAACNFLHCLPGRMADKEVFFANARPLLEEGGVLFGATVLGKGVDAGAVCRRVNAMYNRARIFSNLQDGAVELETALRRHFCRWSLDVVGSVALFVGRA